jgi:hypothetical protein
VWYSVWCSEATYFCRNLDLFGRREKAVNIIEATETALKASQFAGMDYVCVRRRGWVRGLHWKVPRNNKVIMRVQMDAANREIPTFLGVWDIVEEDWEILDRDPEG